MAVKKILTVPNSLLRQKSKPVQKIEKNVLRLIKDLEDTLHVQENPRGVGLSAPQIGVLKRVLVIKLNQEIIPVINPQIISSSKETLLDVFPKEKRFMEGCLSVPGFWGFVNRPYKVKVSFFDLQGNKKTQKFEGKNASLIQHEIDHLEGILFVDRILEQKGKLYKLEKKKDKDIFVEVKI